MFTTTDHRILTAANSLESAATWTATDGLRHTRHAIEWSAEIFNEVLVYSMLSAIESGIVVRGWCDELRQWWVSSGRVYAAMAGIVLLLIGCALMAMAQVTCRWVRDCGVPAVLFGADATCRFLLCYEESAPQVQAAAKVVAADMEPTVTEELIGWAVQRWPQLAA